MRVWRRGLTSWMQAGQLAELADACAVRASSELECAESRASLASVAPPMLGGGKAAAPLPRAVMRKPVAPQTLPGGVPPPPSRSSAADRPRF